MKFRCLFSSVGRRGQLVECFRRSLGALGVTAEILGADCSPSAPAAYLVDRFIQVPRCSEPDFLPIMLRICREDSVRLLVPTIDTELGIYSAHRSEFAAIGTEVAISSPEVVEIAADKVKTHAWLESHGFPTVRQNGLDEMLENESNLQFPLILKPRRGSASIHVQLIASREELRMERSERDDWIVQEVAPGQEHTINVLVDRSGRCVCAVPHLRMEVRAGEVSKGMTRRHAEMMDMARRIAEALPGSSGPLNIQCFLDEGRAIRITEINARFGGGFPLSYEAGADFPRWIVEELLGRPSSASWASWQDGLVMLRYDHAVFLPAEKLRPSNNAQTVRCV